MLPAHIILLTASRYVGLIRHSFTRSHAHSTYMHASICVLPTREKLLFTTSVVKYSPGVIQTVALYYATATL